MPDGTTTHLGLSLFADGETNWGDAADSNATAIDTAIGKNNAFNKLNVAVMTNPANPVADLTNGRIIHVPLSQSTTGFTLQNLSDGVITFHIAQPSGGNCSFAWPSQVVDAGVISQAAGTAAANTVARQTFVYNSQLGKAYAVSPLLWS